MIARNYGDVTVVFEVPLSANAIRTLRRMEEDAAFARELRAVRLLLARLERDPFDPRLRSRQFVTDDLGHVRATAVGYDDWYVFWQVRGTPARIEIIEIAEVPL